MNLSFIPTIFFTFLSCLYSIKAFAASQTLTDIFTSIVKVSQELSAVESAIAYAAGLGFALSAIVKIKRHYTAPQTTPLSSLTLDAFLAIGLLITPSIMHSINNSQHTFKSDVIYLKTTSDKKQTVLQEEPVVANVVNVQPDATSQNQTSTINVNPTINNKTNQDSKEFVKKEPANILSLYEEH